jgi:predicted dehydrogenase
VPNLSSLKLGVVGCGAHASENLLPSLWALRARASVVAVCDVDVRAANAAAEGFPGARVYTNYQNLLEDSGVQAIVTAATPQVHFHVAMLALERGIHVFVEKPELPHKWWARRSD